MSYGPQIVGNIIADSLRGFGAVGPSGIVDTETQVAPSQATALQRLGLGIGRTSFDANETASVDVNPMRPFRLERFTSVATGFLILDIKVGTNSQFIGSQGMPIEMFAADAVGIQMQGDTAVPGVPITIMATNLNNAANVLSGGFVGSAIV